MVAIPSLTQAFSALGSALKVPPASAFNLSGFGASSPAVPALSALQPGVPKTSPLSMLTKPAVPTISPTMSTPNTPTIQAPFSNTPVAPKITTPSSIQGGTTTPVTPKPTYTPSPYVTTPSGAVVDPNTGALISGGGQPSQTNASAQVNEPATPQAYSNYGTYGGASPTGGGGTYNPLITSPEAEGAFKAYQGTLQPTQEELDAMQRLNDLNTSATAAYTNTQNQPIPLEFITGQQAALQRSKAQLAQPLETQLSLLQAKRQMASTASKASLDRLDTQIAAKRDLAKPVSTTLGSTLSRYNPQTGQYETVVNPFGTASGGATGGEADVSTLIGKAMSEGRISSDMVTRYGIPFIAQTLKSDPGYNFITQKASVASDSSSLKTQQAYADTTSRAFNTANDNLKQLISFMTTAKVNTGSTVPAINELQNKVKAGLTDAGTIAAFQAALQGLRAEYAQVLSRGGEVTEGQRNAANALIPDNISPAQLQQVADRLNVEGTNAVKEANAKVTEIKGRIGGNPGSSGGAFNNTSGGTSGSKYDF